MTPRTPEQYESLRQRSREKIMEAALELFATKGYLPTSIHAITRKAGVSKGLLYNYFESKQILLKEVLQKEMDALFNMFPEPEPDQNPLDIVIEIIHLSFNMYRSNDHRSSMLVALLAQPHIHVHFADYYKATVKKIIPGLIALMQALGDKNPKAAAYTLGALLDGIALDWHLLGDDFPLDETEKFIINDLKNKYGSHQ